MKNLKDAEDEYAQAVEGRLGWGERTDEMEAIYGKVRENYRLWKQRLEERTITLRHLEERNL